MAFRSLHWMSTLALTGLTAVATVACSGSDDGPGQTANSGGTTGSGGSSSGGKGGGSGAGGATGLQASVRVVHASPGAPAVDVYVKGQSSPIVEGLAYGSATDYLDVAEGSYELEIRAAGSEPSSDPVFASPLIEIEAGKSYSAVAAGALGSSDLADQFRLVTLEDAFGAAAAGAARVRLLHAGTDAPTVDIDVGNDGSAEIEALERFHPTAASGVDLPADTALQVGIWADGARVTSFTTPELGESESMLIIATGLIEDEPRQSTGFALLAVMADGSTAFIRQNPRLHVLHASPDAGAIDVFVGENEVIDNASFGGLVDLQVPPGSYDLEIYAGHPGPTLKPGKPPAITATTPSVKVGEEYFLVASGLVGGTPAFELLAFQDSFTIDDDGTSRVRVIHASPGAPAVDVSTVAGGKLDQPALVADISFSHATDPAGLALPAGTYPLGVAAAGNPSALAHFNVQLPASQRVFAVAAGSLNSVQTPFQLMIVNTTAPTWTVSALKP